MEEKNEDLNKISIQEAKEMLKRFRRIASDKKMWNKPCFNCESGKKFKNCCRIIALKNANELQDLIFKAKMKSS